MIKEVNLGTKEDPKMVRIEKYLEKEYEEKIIELLKRYKDDVCMKTWRGYPHTLASIR